MSNDPLSDILRLTEAKSVMSGGFMAGGAWALQFPPPPEGEIIFAVVAKGSCSFRLDGHKKIVKGEPGDVALIPGRMGYLVASEMTVPPRDALSVLVEKEGVLAKIGDGADCVVLAGGVTLEPSNAALLTDVLPPLVLVRGASPGAAGLRWIVEQLREEQTSTLPGNRIAAAQLAQLLFTQILRTHLASTEARPKGWLRAVRDARLAPALRLMHADPGRAWKLTDLAKAAAMSRTSFAVHFKSVVGVAPLAYLTAWRMRLAQRTLRQGDASVSEIASTLGYTSEGAFSQAFRRVTGARPRDYRNAARRSEPTPHDAVEVELLPRGATKGDTRALGRVGRLGARGGRLRTAGPARIGPGHESG